MLLTRRSNVLVGSRLPRNLRTKATAPVRIVDPWVDQAIKSTSNHAATVIDRLGVDSISKKQFIKNAIAALPSLPYEDVRETSRLLLLASNLAARWVFRRQAHNRQTTRAAMAIAFDREQNIGLERAIDAIVQRIAMPASKFEELNTQARSRAGRIAGVENVRIVEDAYRALEKSIADGTGLRGLMDSLNTLPRDSGWTWDNPWHARLVYEQNARMAYGSGNFEAIIESGAVGWQFNTYGTSCEICDPLDGEQFALTDRKYFPPAHWNCDCYESAVYGNADLSDSADLVNTPYEESQQKPGAFRYDPASFGAIEPFDLAAVDDDIRVLFEAAAELYGWATKG